MEAKMTALQNPGKEHTYPHKYIPHYPTVLEKVVLKIVEKHTEGRKLD
jgi:hypothetical protein